MCETLLKERKITVIVATFVLLNVCCLQCETSQDMNSIFPLPRDGGLRDCFPRISLSLHFGHEVPVCFQLCLVRFFGSIFGRQMVLRAPTDPFIVYLLE